MTISNATIKDNTVTLIGTAMSGETTVYLDNITSLLTVLSDYTTKTDHDVTITDLTVTSTSIVFTVDNDTNAGIIITVDDKSIPLINFYSVYKAKINYLNKLSNQNVCKNCVEKKFNFAILAMLVRDNLLTDAYNSSKWDDTITYYNQISKTLDFNDIIWDTADNDTITYIQFKPANELISNTCCDGCTCSVCKL